MTGRLRFETEAILIFIYLLSLAWDIIKTYWIEFRHDIHRVFGNRPVSPPQARNWFWEALFGIQLLCLIFCVIVWDRRNPAPLELPVREAIQTGQDLIWTREMGDIRGEL